MSVTAVFNLKGEKISEESHPSETDKSFEELADSWVNRSWDQLEKIIDDVKKRPDDRKEDSA